MNEEHALNRIGEESLAQYQVPKPLARKLGNGIISAYMSLGMTLPVTIVFIIVCSASHSVASSAIFSIAAIALAVFGTISVLFTWLWVIMTPIAIIALILQKRFIGLIPTVLYITVAVLSGFASLSAREHPLPYYAILIAAFICITYISLKYQIKVIKQIQSEPKYGSPKVLGCGGNTHQIAGESL
jgi:hypothetical protein